MAISLQQSMTAGRRVNTESALAIHAVVPEMKVGV